jgi:glycosyltransferase involved in cell wall biosynthesis
MAGLSEDELKNVTFKTIASPLQAYATPESYDERIEESLRLRRLMEQQGQAGGNLGEAADYGGDMYKEIRRYATMAMELAKSEDFDVVHAHDWMTYPAGVAVAAMTGKPLVVHVHSTEFDRSGEHVNQVVYDIEREGMERAAKVITVSHFTRGIVIDRYGISPDKVEVVYNGVERNGQWTVGKTAIRRDEKLVLFLGRITMQKGPEYFLHAAKKVLDVMDNVKFVMAGSGDLMYQSVELAAHLGIGQKVLFTGFLRGDDVGKIYKMADLYVMPSVSEPFGIAPLEALDNDVPVIISKQSGVSEVLKHALKVDFWDVNEMANKIVAVLRYPPLQMTLRNHGNFEVRKLRWKDAAQRCLDVYGDLLVPA